MAEKAKTAVRYYIIFDKMHKWRWWNIFTGKSLAHVWLITELSDKTTAVLDTTMGTVRLVRVNRSVESMIREYYKQGLVIGAYLIKEQNKGLQLFISCVGFCKYVLGINKWWIWTPEQLYKEIYNVYKQAYGEGRDGGNKGCSMGRWRKLGRLLYKRNRN